MPQIRCHNRTVIDGLEWYCNRDKGHDANHAYIVADETGNRKIAREWKQ